MPHSLRPFGALLLPALGWALTASPATDDPTAWARNEYREFVRPLLEERCFDCHAGPEPDAGFDLEAQVDLDDVLADRHRWPYLAQRVLLGQMPPSKRHRVDAADARRLLAFTDRLEDVAYHPERPATLGRPVIRRLNRVEYENTVYDVLGVHFPARERFPPDGIGYGFDTVGEALSVSELLFERFLDAAEEVAAGALGPPAFAEPPVRRFASDELEGASQRGSVKVFSTRSTAEAEHRFAWAGRYAGRVSAAGDQAGDENVRLGIDVDGERVATLEVSAERDSGADEYSFEFTLEEGHPEGATLGVSFLNDYYVPAKDGNRSQDRNAFLAWVEIEGPFDPPPPTRQLERWAERFGALEGPEAEEALEATVEHLGLRLWRRPLERADRRALLRIAPESAPARERLRGALLGLLASPRFLFRFESDDAPDSATRRGLDDYELASRLSYFLWSAPPDEALLERAARGELRTAGALREEVRRLLEHPRSTALARNFAAQWLKLTALGEHSISPEQFPGVDERLLVDMRRETELFFEAILREGRSVWDLLGADFTYANAALAEHYGLPRMTGRALRRVSLDGQDRRGLLGQAAILTVTSDPDRTSPVRRGKWLLETLLGAPPPPPPPGADSFVESAGPGGGLGMRERLTLHRADPNCAVCHDQLDPLGLGLERFDGVGRLRALDGGEAIDASGLLPDGRSFDGHLELGDRLLGDPRFLRNLTEQLLTYALGRGLEPGDAPTVGRLLADLDPDHPTLADLIEGIVLSEPFRFRALPGAR
ncbi:MAG: DUF1592 domain-containing protein [Planctomycetota bacterium]|jgi:mono/diheme cytochrome c family protein